MALSGCRVVCAYAGSINRQAAPGTLLGRPEWSETLAANGTTGKSAPAEDPRGVRGDAVFHIRAAADGYGIIDPSPSAGNPEHPRIVLPGGETVSVRPQPMLSYRWL